MSPRLSGLNDTLSPPEGSATVTARESSQMKKFLEGDEDAIRQTVRFHLPHLTPALVERYVQRLAPLGRSVHECWYGDD